MRPSAKREQACGASRRDRSGRNTPLDVLGEAQKRKTWVEVLDLDVISSDARPTLAPQAIVECADRHAVADMFGSADELVAKLSRDL